MRVSAVRADHYDRHDRHADHGHLGRSDLFDRNRGLGLGLGPDHACHRFHSYGHCHFDDHRNEHVLANHFY